MIRDVPEAGGAPMRPLRLRSLDVMRGGGEGRDRGTRDNQGSTRRRRVS